MEEIIEFYNENKDKQPNELDLEHFYQVKSPFYRSLFRWLIDVLSFSLLADTSKIVNVAHLYSFSLYYLSPDEVDEHSRRLSAPLDFLLVSLLTNRCNEMKQIIWKETDVAQNDIDEFLSNIQEGFKRFFSSRFKIELNSLMDINRSKFIGSLLARNSKRGLLDSFVIDTAAPDFDLKKYIYTPLKEVDFRLYYSQKPAGMHTDKYTLMNLTDYPIYYKIKNTTIKTTDFTITFSNSSGILSSKESKEIGISLNVKFLCNKIVKFPIMFDLSHVKDLEQFGKIEKTFIINIICYEELFGTNPNFLVLTSKGYPAFLDKISKAFFKIELSKQAALEALLVLPDNEKNVNRLKMLVQYDWIDTIQVAPDLITICKYWFAKIPTPLLFEYLNKLHDSTIQVIFKWLINFIVQIISKYKMLHQIISLYNIFKTTTTLYH